MPIIYNRLAWGKEHFRGFTLIELLVVIAILGTLAGIAIPMFSNQIEKARIVKAIAEISIMQKEIAAYVGVASDNFLPNTLDDIERENLLDPWGYPYEYLNFATVTNYQGARKDQFLKPLSSDYDLYSKGKDGQSLKHLNAEVSQDDVLRANDGRFIGLASEF
ncbi:MAG: prepilin-type N-terminal cleavage/methylation domain-containing protein [Desulfobacterales bacterium]|nr:prepilin-type N-terminal cleavage/methylation domain-containing protein [Desulfobacterales bacterium]